MKERKPWEPSFATRLERGYETAAEVAWDIMMDAVVLYAASRYFTAVHGFPVFSAVDVFMAAGTLRAVIRRR